MEFIVCVEGKPKSSTNATTVNQSGVDGAGGACGWLLGSWCCLWRLRPTISTHLWDAATEIHPAEAIQERAVAQVNRHLEEVA